MKDNKIVFIMNMEDGSEKRAKQSRRKVIKTFEKLVKDYPDNNKIAKDLVRILPNVDRVIIPKDDLNRDVPYILCKINDGTIYVEIPRCHKICWSKLKMFTEN